MRDRHNNSEKLLLNILITLKLLNLLNKYVYQLRTYNLFKY